MTSRRELLIARMIGWATQAPETALVAALEAVQAPSFVPSRLAWAERWRRLGRPRPMSLLCAGGHRPRHWKRLARLLRAKLALARSEARMAKTDAKLAREDAKRWKERWNMLIVERAVDIEKPQD